MPIYNIARPHVNKPRVIRKHTTSKGVVYEYIEKNPGTTSIKIADHFNAQRKTIWVHLSTLRREGKIERGEERKDGAILWYVTNTAPTPELPSERILQYVSDRMGDNYTMNDMARDLDIPLGSIHHHINQLIKRKLLVRGFNRTLEDIAKSSKVPTVSSSTKMAVVTKTNEENIAAVVDVLAWKYLKETDDPTLIGFVNWLDKNKDK